ncbi:MAG: hypothetical protein QNJ53_25195 [Pleurocapsa sp. MO_192.B19]|nr:hypothetical protein [Pleurocapsa sp. MO_192.B19]
MNSNKRANRLTMVDRHYKLRQLSAKVNKSVIQFPRKTKPSEKIAQEQNKAA